MPNLVSHSRHPQDEPVLQQLETYLLCQNSNRKAALAIAALYEATKPRAINLGYICNHRSSACNKSIALLQKLSTSGLLALARAVAEELAVLEQLQGMTK